jgi:adenosylcobinamide kinase / adenosylcobinamide-phosphate guanylyltransferase
LSDRVEASTFSHASAALPRLTLVLGGARSGKSRYGETLVEKAAARALYLATAEARDSEMAARIRHHRARRGERWTTIEEPLVLTDRLVTEARPDRPILIDCLTLWLANLMEAGRDIEAESKALVASLSRLAGPVVFIANEVGLGIVPENALARAFRDHAGRLNQTIAAAADRVIFVAAGLPLILKDKNA